ncbi:MAG TPA: hypothetical protein EYP93_03655 [Gammaproteobacteria bacterium]|nr:hypothetical protein [Gammaproteobacteria bacterium]
MSVALAVGSHTLSLSILDDVGAESVDTVVIAVLPAPVNQPPVAAAGPDQSIVDSDSSGAEPVSFNGSTSTDVDGIIVIFEWREGVSLLGSGSTLSTSLPLGDHLVTLTVVDDSGASATDTVLIQVLPPPPNMAPVANAGPGQAITDSDGDGFASTTLDGSLSSDSDGLIVSYSWSEGGLALGAGATLVANLSLGTHTIQLLVTDEDGTSASDSVVITVEAGPPPLQGEVTISGSTLTNRGNPVSWTITLTNTGSTPLIDVQLSRVVSPGNRVKNLRPGAIVNVANVPVGGSVNRVWNGKANKQGTATVTAEGFSGGVSLGTATLQLTVRK